MDTIQYNITSSGHELDVSPEAFGELRSSIDLIDNIAALRNRISEDGYLYLPGYLDRNEVVEVRRSLTHQLSKLGLLDPDHEVMDAVPLKANKNLNPVTKDDSLNRLLYSGRMIEFHERFLGGPVKHFDYTWLRSIGPGKGTQPHCDIVYMGRGTKNLYTTWTPLGDISLEIGGLMVLENSHRQADKLRRYLEHDVDTFCINDSYTDKAGSAKKQLRKGWLTKNPASLREKLGGRWLTTEFRMGDIMVFGMNLIHGSLDNSSDRIRLSSDSRYQLASEPVDERWVGENPIGHSSSGKLGRIC
jgi:hypothetical protein